MKEFSLLGKNICFSDEECVAIEYEKTYLKKAEKSKNAFIGEFKKLQCDDEDYLDQVNQLGFKYITMSIKEIFKKEPAEEVNIGKMQEWYSDLVNKNWNYVMDSFLEKYFEILGDEETERIYRQYRKANRGQWIGGGFGLSGAIKGTAMAGGLNLANSGLHSLVNMIGNAGSSFKATSRLVATRSIYSEKFGKAIYNIIFTTKIIEMYYVYGEDEIGKYLIYHREKTRQAEQITGRYNSAIKNEGRLIESIKVYPFYFPTYEIILKEFGDSKGELRELVKFLGLDTEYINCAEKILKEALGKIEEDNLESLQNGLTRIVFKGNFLGFHDQNQEKQLEKKIAELDLKERTVSDIVVSDKNKISTGETKVFETREKAKGAKKAKSEIIQLFKKSLDIEDETELKEIYHSIETMVQEYSIGMSICQVIGKRLNNIDIEKRTVNGKIYETREKAEEARNRTVDKITFETLEEKELYIKEKKQYDDILRKCYTNKGRFAFLIGAYVELRKYKWNSKHIQEEIREYPQLIKEGYKYVPREEKNENVIIGGLGSLLLWGAITIFAGSLLISSVLSLNIIWIIIMLIILYNLIEKLKDIIEDVKDDLEDNIELEKDKHNLSKLIVETDRGLKIAGTDIYLDEPIDFNQQFFSNDNSDKDNQNTAKRQFDKQDNSRENAKFSTEQTAKSKQQKNVQSWTVRGVTYFSENDAKQAQNEHLILDNLVTNLMNIKSQKERREYFEKYRVNFVSGDVRRRYELLRTKIEMGPPLSEKINKIYGITILLAFFVDIIGISLFPSLNDYWTLILLWVVLGIFVWPIWKIIQLIKRRNPKYYKNLKGI